MNVRKVLVFPAGTEVGLEIYQALRHSKEVEVYGAGQAISNPAPFVFEYYYELPSIYEEGWLNALNALCLQLGIDYIFPAYDDVIIALIACKDKIVSTILTAPEEACRITRSKSLTYEKLQKFVRVPTLYDHGSERSFPLFVKPDRGQGSQGARLVCDETELAIATKAIQDPILCEYLPGEEYTVDCFSDRDHGVLFHGARVRLRMRNGIAVHTKSILLEEAGIIAQNIHAILDLRGAWFFQLKRASSGELTLLEVAPRIAGSMSTHRIQGVNFPLLTIFEHERLPLKILANDFMVELDRSLHNRYRLAFSYDALYIDLDDTIIFRGKVNLDALQLIFNCINKKIPVILITRHDGDLLAVLKMYRLVGLFDDVIHIDRFQRKSDCIRHENSIFVDDSFSERNDVRERCGIRTFDCSMIDALISHHPSD